MGKYLGTEEELEAKLKEAAERVPLGLYAHYENGEKYLVTGHAIARYSGDICVLYTSQYGKYLQFVRTLAEWFIPGEIDGKEVERFQKI